MLFRGFGVPIVLVGHSRAASIYTNDWDVHLMPSIDFNSPVSSAPIDRLALGVGWVRPGVAGIGGTLNPSGLISYCPVYSSYAFEGIEE